MSMDSISVQIVPPFGGDITINTVSEVVIETDIRTVYVPGTGGGSGDVPDATTSVKGKVKLAGDLSGTADAPKVTALKDKANTSDVYTKVAVNDMVSALQTDINSKPSMAAVQDYVDTHAGSGGGTVDAYTKAETNTLLDEKADVGDAVALADAKPKAPARVGFAGSEATAARGDHIHPAQEPLTFWSSKNDELYVIGYPRAGADYGMGEYEASLQPWPLSVPFIIKKMTVMVDQAGAAGEKTRVAIYKTDEFGEVGDLIADLGQIPIDVAGPVEVTLASPVTVPAGLLWIAMAGGTDYTARLGCVSGPSYIWMPSLHILHGDTRGVGFRTKTYGGTLLGMYINGFPASKPGLDILIPSDLMPRIGFVGRYVSSGGL